MGLDIEIYKRAKVKGELEDQEWNLWKADGYFRKLWVMTDYFEFEFRTRQTNCPIIELGKEEVEKFYRDIVNIQVLGKPPKDSDFRWSEYIDDSHLEWQIDELVRVFMYILSDWNEEEEGVYMYASF